jgi:hypothetical protein
MERLRLVVSPSQSRDSMRLSSKKEESKTASVWTHRVSASKGRDTVNRLCGIWWANILREDVGEIHEIKFRSGVAQSVRIGHGSQSAKTIIVEINSPDHQTRKAHFVGIVDLHLKGGLVVKRDPAVVIVYHIPNSSLFVKICSATNILADLRDFSIR